MSGGRTWILPVISVLALALVIPSTAPVASSQPAIVVFIGSPSVVSIDSWKLLNMTLQDEVPGQTGLVLFAVWKNPPDIP